MEILRILVLWILFWILLLTHGNGSEISDKLSTGFNDGAKGFLLGLEKLVTPEKLLGFISKLSGFIGIAGGFLSFLFIFIPKQESAELKFMKKKFAEVNMKLDRMFNEFDNVKNIITLENQRAAYIDDATAILFGYKQLTEHFIHEISETNCTTPRDCLRQRLVVAESYQKHFNIKHRLYKILRGTTESISVFNDPLLDLIKRKYKCNIGEVIRFANGVILLAFKGQHVVIAHEKLTGSNASIIFAVKEWSDLVYSIRNKVEDIKVECYKNIDEYMKDDVEDTIYQTNMPSNKQAADSLKNKLDIKYPWLYWTVLSYGSYGAQNHWGFSIFWNMPKLREKRKRNLRVITHDKGTYSYYNLRKEMLDVIDDAFSVTNFSSPGNMVKYSAKLVYKMLKDKLESHTDVWPKLSAFIVLRNPNDLQIAAESKQLNLIYRSRDHDTFVVLASFKSSQQIDGVLCPFNCSAKGLTVHKPHSSSCYCRCNAYFQGNNCQHYSGVNLEDNVYKILAASARIPKLTNIYYKLSDMQDIVGVSLDRIQDSLQKKYDNLNKRLTKEFQWNNLIVQYAHDIRQLTYYINRFKLLNSSSPLFVNESTVLATTILQSGNVPKWTYELNLLLVGRADILIQHKPLLEIISSRHIDIACSLDYKNALDNIWRQLFILQSQAFIIWVQAKEILKQSSNAVTSRYVLTVENQQTFFRNNTCELFVENSLNLNCSGGFYLFPKTKLLNTCKKNHYKVGDASVSCHSGTTHCLACDCNPAGSSNTECNDIDGQCVCKDNYFGKQCRDRHCKWTPFGKLGSCNKSCDYGGIRTRIRKQAITQKGKGKFCSGDAMEYHNCFNECCSGYYNCLENKTCIPQEYVCDYDNDCGNWQDEKICKKNCSIEYTLWNDAGGGNAAYLDRHSLNCYGNSVLNMFQLERSGTSIRYSYRCCDVSIRLSNKNMFSFTAEQNSFTDDGSQNTVYLDRQHISCGTHGLLYRVKLIRDVGHTLWRYKYGCLQVLGDYRGRLSCYDYSTGYTRDGNGQNYYLDRQHVSCDHDYFMQYIHLNRNSDHTHIRYTIRCCEITVPLRGGFRGFLPEATDALLMLMKRMKTFSSYVSSLST